MFFEYSRIQQISMTVKKWQQLTLGSFVALKKHTEYFSFSDKFFRLTFKFVFFW